MEFKEAESWNIQGEQSNTAGNSTPLFLVEDQVEPTRQQGPPSRLPKLHIQGETSRHGEQQAHGPHSTSEWDPTITLLRNKNTRILREINNQDDEIDMQGLYILRRLLKKVNGFKQWMKKLMQLKKMTPRVL